MNKSVAIITARGGSKRIPHKNIKFFCGKPIIEYSIDAALGSKIFDEVMVSTDDTEIAEIAFKHGAVVPFMRSACSSNDFATTADVISEVLNEYRKLGKNFEYACCIYPTAPFITPQKIRMGMELLISKKADTVIPLVAYSFPPQRGMLIRNNMVQYQYPEYMTSRSQDLETVYHDCGQFYCLNVNSFTKTGKLIGEKTFPIILNEKEVQDIDNISDWELAEIKYKLMTEEKNHEI